MVAIDYETTLIEGRPPMQSFRVPLAAAVTALAAAILAATSFAATPKKPVAFTVSFTGKAVVKSTGDAAQITSATATGTSRALGKVALLGTGSGIKSDPCPLFGGPATMTTKAGKIKFVIAPTGGSACTDEAQQQFTISGRATIKGGTAKYAKAKGTFKFAGSYDRGTGGFAVKFVGTLTA
jgi:hypothetical protein